MVSAEVESSMARELAETRPSPCFSGRSAPTTPRPVTPFRRHYTLSRRRDAWHRRRVDPIFAEAGVVSMTVSSPEMVEPKVLKEIPPSEEAEGEGVEGPSEEPGKPLKINRDLLLYRCRVKRRRAERAPTAHRRMDLLKEAEMGYRRVIEMDATDGRPYVGLGRLLVQQHRFDEARKVYEDGCTATQGSNAYVWTAWANLEARKGTLRKARKLYDAAVVANMSHQAAWHGWGMLEKRDRNYVRARDCWIRGIKNAKRSPSPYLFNSLAVLAAELGRVDEAREWFQKGTKTEFGSGSQALWQAWALMEAEKGDKAAARELFRKALEVSPKSRYTHLAWGLFEKEEGQLDKAQALLEQGHRLNPKDPAILQAWGVLEAQLGNIDKAREQFEKGAKVDRKHQPVWQAWGVMEFRQGNLTRARELFQEGVWAGPNSKDVAFVFQAWGVLEMSAGNAGLARELFKCAVKADPKNETTWNTWVKLEERLGAYERANELRNLSSQRRMEVVVPSNFTTLEESGGSNLRPLFEKISEWFQKFGTLKRESTKVEEEIEES